MLVYTSTEVREFVGLHASACTCAEVRAWSRAFFFAGYHLCYQNLSLKEKLSTEARLAARELFRSTCLHPLLMRLQTMPRFLPH